MELSKEVPDLLARPLPYALEVLEQQGWQVQVVRAEPYFHRASQVWQDDHAYVLKQCILSDHTLQIIVGCKFEGRCTQDGTQD